MLNFPDKREQTNAAADAQSFDEIWLYPALKYHVRRNFLIVLQITTLCKLLQF